MLLVFRLPNVHQLPAGLEMKLLDPYLLAEKPLALNRLLIEEKALPPNLRQMALRNHCHLASLLP